MADPLVFHYKDLSNTIKLTWAQMNQNLRSIEDGVIIVQDAELNTAQLENSAALLRDQAQASESKAKKWASDPEDTAVEGGLYSSLHYAAKSSASANASSQSKSDADDARDAAIQAKDDTITLKGQANQSALDAAQSAADADQSAIDAAQSAADAQTQAESIETAVEPTPNKIPLADDSGTIKQAWVSGLEFELDALRAARLREQYGDGPYPVLDLGFVGAKRLDPRVNFSRATPTWDWDEHGNFRKYEIDEPCFAYDPVTGEAKGLQVYPARTNLALWSGDVTKWNFGGTAAAGQLSSLGGNTAVKLGGIGTTVRTVTATSRQMMFRFVFKPVFSDTNNYTFLIRNSTKGVGGTSAIYSLVTNTITSPDEFRWLEDLGNGFYAINLVSSPDFFDVGDVVQIYYGKTGAGQGGPDWSIIADYLQIEAGTTPTPYIPTEGSQVTVAATRLSMPIEDFTTGSALIDFTLEQIATTGFAMRLQDGNASTRYMALGYTTAASKYRILTDFYSRNGGTAIATKAPTGFNESAVGENCKIAASWDSDGSHSMSANGSDATNGDQPSGMPEVDTLRLFSDVGAGSSVAMGGYTRSILLYKFKLSGEQLKALTA